MNHSLFLSGMGIGLILCRQPEQCCDFMSIVMVACPEHSFALSLKYVEFPLLITSAIITLSAAVYDLPRLLG